MTDQKQEIHFYSRAGVIGGLVAGTIVTVMFIHLVLPHTHALSPSYMDGITASWRTAPLAVLLAGAIGFCSLCTAMFMGLAEDMADPGRKHRQIGLWPQDAVLEQKVMSFMAPIMSVVAVLIVWYFMLGEASPMHVPAFGAFAGFAGPLMASWSVWVVSFFAAGVTVLLLAAPKTVPTKPVNSVEV